MLEARSLCLEHRLAGVSCMLQRGVITAICGPNGAGKSSLLQALAGLVRVDKGGVYLNGAYLDVAPERHKRIGYLPQAAPVAWDITVRALVSLGRIPHRDQAIAPVDAALAALDLTELQHRRAQSLSGGEAARTMLARVLASESEWILADEPLAALDLAHQMSVMQHLKRCAIDGKGVVVVLHDLSMAMNYADRVLVLQDGVLVSDAAPNIALATQMIEQVWGVQVQWLGQSGTWALVPMPTVPGPCPEKTSKIAGSN